MLSLEKQNPSHRPINTIVIPTPTGIQLSNCHSGETCLVLDTEAGIQNVLPVIPT